MKTCTKMMERVVRVGFALALAACGSGDPEDTDGNETESGGETSESGTSEGGMIEPPPDYDCGAVMQACVDETSCGPLASDYQPRVDDSQDDAWAACVTDGGVYELVSSPPSSIARVEAFEQIADLLWRSGQVPTAADFTAAREVYLTPEGLESRVVRREDLHYPPIPEADWDPAVESDKQCSVPANVEEYPDRCAGPALIAPLVNDAFVAGESGEGDLTVEAAKIEAALLWFLYISTYKEASTCATNAAKDCDSSWAYYTGGNQLDGGVGLSGYVREYSENTHGRIFDGVLAARCWRNLVGDGDPFPLLDELEQADQDLFAQAHEQLDNALHRGFALVVRERLIDHIGGLQNGDHVDATWAFLQTAGPVLAREAHELDGAQAAVLDSLWQSDGGDETALAEGVATLDAVFPCP